MGLNSPFFLLLKDLSLVGKLQNGSDFQGKCIYIHVIHISVLSHVLTQSADFMDADDIII